ncbi:hypothetical protein AQUCO_04300015v1 [Aquilegia coerulea]|uniref:Uncharacterized protein n=1 Tax=Aquilegia coerulea TaxID=218851 RepID=A0A2G5CNG7_AQUCA|nr:hypothetical protein AQUCO_04300015v1 [Aquilegia coerulea]
MCDQLGHCGDECQWVYSHCKKTNCEGIMRLTTSNTPENLARKFLRCHLCGKFKWLDEAMRDEATTSSSSVKGCFICDDLDHWKKDCEWVDSECRTKGCKGRRNVKTSGKQGTVGDKYLKCYTCGNFQWLREAKKEKEKATEDFQNHVNAIVTVKMDFQEFCDHFAGTRINKK